jgi:hypothetical protein
VIGGDERINDVRNNLRSYNFSLSIKHDLAGYLNCGVHIGLGKYNN